MAEALFGAPLKLGLFWGCIGTNYEQALKRLGGSRCGLCRACFEKSHLRLQQPGASNLEPIGKQGSA